VAEFKTLEFPNTSAGQEEKVDELRTHSRAGWRVVSETVTPGQFRGDRACCLYMLCAPCAFFAGSTDGKIVVTLQREAGDIPPMPPIDPSRQVSKQEALERIRVAWGDAADVQEDGSQKVVGVVKRVGGRTVLAARGRGGTWTEALLQAGLK
jgi:hypothetical protein